MNIDKLDPKSHFYHHTQQVCLTGRLPISPDTYIFTFTFEDPQDCLGLLITQHLLIYGENSKGEVVSRKYSATSPFEQKGTFSIPIKIYRPDPNHPIYPNGGELTPWLERLGVLFHIHFRLGQKQLLNDQWENLFTQEWYSHLRPKENKDRKISTIKTILMTAGGTGITPMYQLIQAIINNPNDQTQIYLLYANRSEADILLRSTLETFRENNPDRLKILYVVDKVNETWKGQVGYVTLEMMKLFFPNPDDQILATICGPKPMNKLVVQQYLDFGIHHSNILKF